MTEMTLGGAGQARRYLGEAVPLAPRLDPAARLHAKAMLAALA